MTVDSAPPTGLGQNYITLVACSAPSFENTREFYSLDTALRWEQEAFVHLWSAGATMWQSKAACKMSERQIKNRII